MVSFDQKAFFGLLGLLKLVVATPVAEPPCEPGSYTPYTYVGCFEDDPNARSLDYNSGLDFGSMTVDICTAACKANGYHYAGLEYYGMIRVHYIFSSEARIC